MLSEDIWLGSEFALVSYEKGFFFVIFLLHVIQSGQVNKPVNQKNSSRTLKSKVPGQFKENKKMLW